MTKKISAFLQNFRVYVVIGVTLLLVLLVLLLIIMNITKDKTENSNEINPSTTTIQEFEQSTKIDQQESQEKPLEPTPPAIEIPNFKK
jgi:membrane protein insertase Oxa1/YidC/SpoIIIJ